MENKSTVPVTLHINPEHGGLRAAIVVSLIVGSILGFFLVRQLVGRINDDFPDYTVLVSCAGGLIIGLMTIWIVERILKQTWHSGQRVELDEKGITLFNRVERSVALKWDDVLVNRNWTFHLSGFHRVARESRLPKKWVCLSSMIQRDETRLIIFSYMSPDKGSHLLDGTVGKLAYRTIDPKEVYDTSVRVRIGPTFYPTIPPAILTGPNGRYWMAEKRRWEHGLELSPKDYETFVTFISQYITSEKIEE